MCKPVISPTICGLPLDTFKRKPTPAELAYSFSELNDDQQAEFFVIVDHIVQETWGGTTGGMQWHFVGDHLAECPDAEGGRFIVESIYESMKGRLERLAIDPNDRHKKLTVTEVPKMSWPNGNPDGRVL